jgi:hypothetical protein
LSDDWRAWLVENVGLGVTDEDLLEGLAAAGVPRAIAASEIAAVRGSPAAVGARRIALRLRQHELGAALRRALLERAATPTIERRRGVSADEFFDRYYASGRPVVLTDLLDTWPAARRWSPEYFKERYGECVVEVMSGRNADAACDSHFEDFSEQVSLGAFCDRVTSSGPTNDFYLVANNRAINHEPLRSLLADVAAPHPYLDDRRDPAWTSLWFGPRGTHTRLHHDSANVLFCQVYGTKRFSLASPAETALLAGVHHGFFADVDATTAARSEGDGGKGVRVMEVELTAGETLFVPVGWWHEVLALSVSISLSLTAFRRSNRFEWYTPGKM